MSVVTAEDIIALNARHLGGKAAVRDAGLVASVAFRPQAIMFGEELLPSLAEKAAAILHGLICFHPFTDANKRTAWAAMELLLGLNGAACTLSNEEAFQLVLRVAENCSTTEVTDLAATLDESIVQTG